jgi:hypothetical protein
MNYRHALLILILALTSTSTLSSPAIGDTGSYEVTACNYAPETENHSWVWKSSDSAIPSHYAEHESCPDRLGGDGGTSDQEGGLSTTDALGLPSGAPPGTSAGWTFTAPAGTTIAGISYERYIGHVEDPDNYWAPALRADGHIITGESCDDTVQDGESCLVGGPPNEGIEPATITGLSAHELNLGIICEAHSEEECITGATRHKSWAAMYGATVTLNDPTPPTLDTPTGTLWEHSQYTKGTKTVTVEAKDTGGGIKTIELASDGHVLQTYTATCNYTHTVPCASSTTATLLLDTTALTDGHHNITVLATDAAGNESTAAATEVDVENNPPPAPTNLTATPTEPASGRVTVTWTTPTPLSSPIVSANYQLCPTIPPGTCSTGTPDTGSRLALTLPAPGTWTLAVWLTNAAGNSSPVDAAYLTLVRTVAPLEEGFASPPLTSSPTPPSSSAPPAPTSTPPKATHLRAAATLRRRTLTIRITGPRNAAIRIHYTDMSRRHLVAQGTRDASLHSGAASVVFHIPAHRTVGTIRAVVRSADQTASLVVAPRHLTT